MLIDRRPKSPRFPGGNFLEAIRSPPYIQDALDETEYVTGALSTAAGPLDRRFRASRESRVRGVKPDVVVDEHSSRTVEKFATCWLPAAPWFVPPEVA
jgi:hypothetical protein